MSITILSTTQQSNEKAKLQFLIANLQKSPLSKEAKNRLFDGSDFLLELWLVLGWFCGGSGVVPAGSGLVLGTFCLVLGVVSSLILAWKLMNTAM